MLLNLKEILDVAQKNGFAVGAFNTGCGGAGGRKFYTGNSAVCSGRV